MKHCICRTRELKILVCFKACRTLLPDNKRYFACYLWRIKYFKIVLYVQDKQAALVANLLTCEVKGVLYTP